MWIWHLSNPITTLGHITQMLFRHWLWWTPKNVHHWPWSMELLPVLEPISFGDVRYLQLRDLFQNVCFHRQRTLMIFSKPQHTVKMTWCTATNVKRKKRQPVWVSNRCVSRNCGKSCVSGLKQSSCVLLRCVRWCTLRRFWRFFSRDFSLMAAPCHI